MNKNGFTLIELLIVITIIIGIIVAIAVPFFTGKTYDGSVQTRTSNNLNFERITRDSEYTASNGERCMVFYSGDKIVGVTCK